MTGLRFVIVAVIFVNGFPQGLSQPPGLPEFTIEPQPTTATVGSSVIFHCQAFGGSAVPVISWQRHVDPDDRMMIQADSKYQPYSNGSLLIRDVQFGDGSFYSCLAENPYGTVIKTVSLFVVEQDATLRFTNTPSNTTVMEDQSIRWQCNTDMTSQITWERVGGFMPIDRIFEPVNGVLEVSPVLPEDQGFYRCTAAAAGSTITHTFYLNVLFSPRITQHPGTRLEIIERRDLVMDCVVQGNPPPERRWILPSTEVVLVPSVFGDGEVFTNGTMLVRSITETMAGKYTCAATNEIDSVQANTFVYVMYEPRLIWQPTSTEVEIGSQVKLECEAVAYPEHTTQWFKVGQDDPIEANEEYLITAEGALIINNMQISHQGTYTCVTENEIGRVEASAAVRLVAHPSVHIDGATVVVAIGTNVMLNCSVTGDPQPTMRWLRRNNQPLVLDDNMVLYSNLSLSIRSIRPGQFGAYTCSATNRLGSDSATVTLQTVDIPVFVGRPTDTTVKEGETVSIRCEGQGRVKPVSSWFSISTEGERVQLPVPGSADDVEVTSDGYLIIRNVNRQHEGTYECVISNNVGEATATVRLDVEYAPVVEPPEEEVSTIAGRQFTLRCVSDADPPADVTWQPPREQPIIRQDPSGQIANEYTIVRSDLIVRTADVQKHHGKWTCNACNRQGCGTASRQVLVQGPPVITDVEANWISEREVIELSASVIGFPQPDITFFRGQQMIDPNNPPEGHRVTDGNVLEIAGGSAGSAYTFDVRNYYGSDRATITVPGRVSGVALSQVTNTSVTVAWDDENTVSTLPTERFSIHVTNENTSAVSVIRADQSPVVIEDLSPYSTYTVTVASENVLGSSPFSQPLTFVTPPGVPGDPREISSRWEDTALIITWQQPEHFHGSLDDIRYEIQYRAYTPDDTTMTLMHDATLGTVKYIYGLSRAFGIFVTVTTVNTRANLRSRPVTINVPVYSTEDLPVPGAVRAEHVNATAIQVFWELPETNDINHDSFYVRLSETSNRGQVVSNAMVRNIDARNHTIGGLNPAIGYTVELATQNTAGFSQFSEPVSLPPYRSTEPPIEPLLPGDDDDDDDLSVGAIIGIVVAIAVALFILLVLCILCIQWQRSQKRERKERIIDSIYADNRSIQYTNLGYKPDSDITTNRSNVRGQYDVQVATKQHYIKANQPRKVYTVSKEETDPPIAYSVPAGADRRHNEEENPHTDPRVGSLENGAEFGYYKVRVSPPKFDEMYKLPADSYSHLLDNIDTAYAFESPTRKRKYKPRLRDGDIDNAIIVTRPVYSTPTRPAYSRVQKKLKKTATPSPVLRSAMRSTPSPKSYRSTASQSPSNTSRVRFEDQSGFEGATTAMENPLFQPIRIQHSDGSYMHHFRPITQQHTTPVHLQGSVATAVVKPEPIHYTGLSEKPLPVFGVPKQESSRGRPGGKKTPAGDSSVDEGYVDSGNESGGFILGTTGTYPRSYSEERRYQHGSLFSKTVPWQRL